MKVPPEEKFGPLNRCIYCDKETRPDALTDEHIIPLSLGGHRVLEKASCRYCADHTGAVNGHCAGTIFRALRVHHEAPTRRPRDRPKTLTMMGEQPAHDRVNISARERAEISVDEAVGFVTFLIFPAPGILRGATPDPKILQIGHVVCETTDDATDRARKLKQEGRPHSAFVEFEVFKFLRLLAQIAHGYAVVTLGMDSFVHRLPPIILGRDPCASQYIGSDLGDAIPLLEAPASSTIHQVKGGILQDADRKLFAVQIQMFSFLRPLPPTYLVVAGEMR